MTAPTHGRDDQWWLEHYGCTRAALLQAVLAERFPPPPTGRDQPTSPAVRAAYTYRGAA